MLSDKEEATVGNGSEVHDRHVANPSGASSSNGTNNKKRVYADIMLQQEEDNVGIGRTTRSRARAQQQQQQQQQQSEESFEVPGLTNTRRGGPPNKMARRR